MTPDPTAPSAPDSLADKVFEGDTVQYPTPVGEDNRPMPFDDGQELLLPEDLQKLLEGRYIIEEFLGQGGMGSVYKGLQLPLRRPVAIKIMRKGVGAEFDFEERFKREAYVMASLTHPHIVQVYDCGDAGKSYLFISMEFVEGGDLASELRQKKMGPERALALIRQICDALQCAHESGIVHRDIKPANIFITQEGHAKVADFGLAKTLDAKSFMTQTGVGVGTPDYAAPEQVDGAKDLDHRADIYALGVMMYQMLTGVLPRGAYRPPSQRVSIDPRLDAVVFKAMEHKRSERYQSAAEFKVNLDGISGSAARAVSDAGSLGNPRPTELAVPPNGSSIQSAFKDREPKGQTAPSNSIQRDASVKSPAARSIPFRPAVTARSHAARPSRPTKPLPRPPTLPARKRAKTEIFVFILLLAGATGLLSGAAGMWYVLRKSKPDAVSRTASATTSAADSKTGGTNPGQAASVPVVVTAPASGAASATPPSEPLSRVPDNALFPPVKSVEGIAWVLTSADYEWSAPFNLGPNINGLSFDGKPTLSADGLVLIFASTRPGGKGGSDIYEARRRSVDEPFEGAKNLSEVNSSDHDCCPSLSADGLTLLFNHNSASNPRSDVYITTRLDRDSPWGLPASVVPNVSTSAHENGRLSADGLTIIFGSNRVGGKGGNDLFFSRRRSLKDAWGPAESLGDEVNTPDNEPHGILLSDNRTLLFIRGVRQFDAGKSTYAVLIARADASGRFAVISSVALPAMLPSDSLPAVWMSPDCWTAWVSGYARGGQGSADIWQVQRVPKADAKAATTAPAQ